MKYLIALSLLLTGCATGTAEEWGQAFGGMAAYQTQLNQEQQQFAEQQRQPARQTDMNCKRDCLSQGYNHPLCDSKCSY